MVKERKLESFSHLDASRHVKSRHLTEAKFGTADGCCQALDHSLSSLSYTPISSRD
jgi:hypothetical protein